VEAVRADERKTDFKLLTFGQIRQQKNWACTGAYFANLKLSCSQRRGDFGPE
jgi:hypothetical protein